LVDTRNRRSKSDTGEAKIRWTRHRLQTRSLKETKHHVHTIMRFARFQSRRERGGGEERVWNVEHCCQPCISAAVHNTPFRNVLLTYVAQRYRAQRYASLNGTRQRTNSLLDIRSYFLYHVTCSYTHVNNIHQKLELKRSSHEENYVSERTSYTLRSL